MNRPFHGNPFVSKALAARIGIELLDVRRIFDDSTAVLLNGKDARVLHRLFEAMLVHS